MSQPNGRTRRGFSLVELMITTVVLGVIGIGVAGVNGPASRSMETDTARIDARARATRGLETLGRTLRSVALSSLRTIPEGFESLQPVADGVKMDDFSFRSYRFDAAAPDAIPELWPAAAAGPCSVRFQPSPEDPQNGLDDDQDGLVDGRDLVLLVPGQAAVRLVQNVSNGSFQITDRTLRVTVNVTLRSSSGTTIMETATTAVEIRND